MADVRNRRVSEHQVRGHCSRKNLQANAPGNARAFGQKGSPTKERAGDRMNYAPRTGFPCRMCGIPNAFLHGSSITEKNYSPPVSQVRTTKMDNNEKEIYWKRMYENQCFNRSLSEDHWAKQCRKLLKQRDDAYRALRKKRFSLTRWLRTLFLRKPSEEEA